MAALMATSASAASDGTLNYREGRERTWLCQNSGYGGTPREPIHNAIFAKFFACAWCNVATHGLPFLKIPHGYNLPSIA